MFEPGQNKECDEYYTLEFLVVLGVISPYTT